MWLTQSKEVTPEHQTLLELVTPMLGAGSGLHIEGSDPGYPEGSKPPTSPPTCWDILAQVKTQETVSSPPHSLEGLTRQLPPIHNRGSRKMSDLGRGGG